MTAIVTLNQAAQALTTNLSSTTGTVNNALSAAMKNAGIFPSIAAVGATLSTTHAITFNNASSAIALTPVVWDGISLNGATYGTWNTAPVSLTLSGQTVSCPANSVFTFNRACVASVSFTIGGYMSANKAGGSCGIAFYNILGGVSYPLTVTHAVIPYSASLGLTSYSDGAAGHGNYAAGDSIVCAGFTANLLADTVTATAAYYGLPGSLGIGNLSIVNHN